MLFRRPTRRLLMESGRRTAEGQNFFFVPKQINKTFERELGNMAHKFSVDEVSLCRRNIQFTVDSPTVDAAFGLRIAEAKAEVALPGYRKGKVPTGLIEKRFGKQIAQQVRDQLINQTCKYDYWSI